MSTTYYLSTDTPFVKAKTLQCETRHCKRPAVAFITERFDSPVYEAQAACQECTWAAHSAGKFVSAIEAMMNFSDVDIQAALDQQRHLLAERTARS